MTHVYTLEAGRCIVRDGVPIATVSRVGSDSKGHALTPAEVDEFARRVVTALNACEVLIHPDLATAPDHLQAVIDLAREAVL